jgi:hypothetical protein
MRVEPQAAGRAVYDERDRTFLTIYQRLRPLDRRVDKGAQ